MKKIILILLLVIALSSCELPEAPEPRKPVSVCKKITDKQTPIENNFSGTDFFIGNGSVTKSQTNYYLVFEDGTDKNVSRKTYNKNKIWGNYCTTIYR